MFRTGGAQPEPLAQIDRPTFLARAQGAIFGVSEVGHGKIFRVGSGLGPTHGTVPLGGLGGLGGGTVANGLDGEPIASGGSHPCHIAASPDGRWLYVSNYGDGVVRAVEVADEGFGQIVDLLHTGSGPVTDRQTGPHAHVSAVVNGQLVIADLGTDNLRVHNLTDGRPALEPKLVQMPAGSGPRHFTRVGDTLLVAGELDGSITEVSTTSWEVTRTVPAATAKGEHYLSHILSTDGAIIVGVRGSNTLSVLDQNLTIVQEIPTAAWPRHFAIAHAEEGVAVIVAGERSDEVVGHSLVRRDGAVRVGEITDRIKVSTPMFIGVGEQF